MSLSPQVIDAMVANGATVEMLAAVMKADIEVRARHDAEVAAAAAERLAAEDRSARERRAKGAEKKRRQRAGNGVPACPQVSPGTEGDIGGRKGTIPETKVSPTPPSKTQTLTPFTPLKGGVSPIPNGPSAEAAEQGGPATPPAVSPVAKPAKPKSSDAPTAAEMVEFEAWWRIWQNRVAKSAAVTAFVRVRRRDEVSIDALVAATAAYFASIAKSGYAAAHPATWLNGRRWEDEHGAVAGSVPVEPADVAGWSSERWASVVGTWKASGRWPAGIGPPPDDPTTFAPVSLRPTQARNAA